jgi:formylglycine-generating enzyme required for sulfatase activity
MKRRNLLVCWVIFMVLVGTGCAPSTPENIASTPTSPTVTIPVATEIPITETPALVPTADLSMEIGSTHAYVDGSLLVAVPEGEFLMGGDSDNPEHKVFLSDFWIYSTEVTNQQYSLCESLGECTPPDPDDNHSYADRLHANDPVVGVTYDQALSYCSFVHGRLPTEAEWEKAARNTASDLYPWGNAMPTCDLLNFNDCVGTATKVIDYKTGVSVYGAMDMAGNVFEWVADWFDPDYYGVSPGENPQGPTSGTVRSVRSSSYASDADQARIVNRSSEDPQSHRPDLGFRCVVEDPTYFAPFCASPLIYDTQTQTSSSSEACPTLDITQAQYCIGKLPATNVKFDGPSDSTIDSSNCVPSEDPDLFTCQTPGTIVSITANCQLDGAGNPSCPSGYSQKDNACISNGGTGQCLTGNYDTVQQCCGASAEEAGLSSPATICPVGTFYAMGENACLSYPVQGIVTVSLDVGFTSCNVVGGGGGGGDDGGSGSEETCCQEPAGGCGISTFWDPVQCCCSVDGYTCDYKPSCP